MKLTTYGRAKGNLPLPCTLSIYGLDYKHKLDAPPKWSDDVILLIDDDTCSVLGVGYWQAITHVVEVLDRLYASGFPLEEAVEEVGGFLEFAPNGSIRKYFIPSPTGAFRLEVGAETRIITPDGKGGWTEVQPGQVNESILKHFLLKLVQMVEGTDAVRGWDE